MDILKIHLNISLLCYRMGFHNLELYYFIATLSNAVIKAIGQLSMHYKYIFLNIFYDYKIPRVALKNRNNQDIATRVWLLSSCLIHLYVSIIFILFPLQQRWLISFLE